MPLANKVYAVPKSGAHARNATLSTAQTIAMPAGAVACFLHAKTQNVRVTFDGSTPSTTNGLGIIAGAQPVFFPIADDTTLKAIEEAASAEINVLWLT